MYSFQEASKVFEQYYQDNIIFPSSPFNLYEPCRYTLSGNGKRVRPVLCLMAFQLFEATITEDVLHTAMSFEMFHNFTLIHDDIMDDAPIRRGKPSVYNKFGMTGAILSGDVMNISAYDRLARVQDSEKLVALFKLFNKTAIEICEGQQLDMDFEERRHVALPEYLEMIRLKTSVLLAACLQSGGILAGAASDALDLLYDFGINLGIAFQVQDDYLDTFGTPENFGKQPGGDIRGNKKTALMILLESAMQQGAFEDFINHAQLLSDDDKYQIVKEQYVTAGVDEQVKSLVADYTRKAFDCLDRLNVDTAKKVYLQNLAHYLLNRTN